VADWRYLFNFFFLLSNQLHLLKRESDCATGRTSLVCQHSTATWSLLTCIQINLRDGHFPGDPWLTMAAPTSSTRSILLMWIALTTVLEIHGVGVNKTSPILLPNQQCQSTENNSSTDSNTQQEFLDRRSSTVERPSTQLWSPSLWLFQTISENSFIWWPKCWVTLLNL